jgi:hypothetical protein
MSQEISIFYFLTSPEAVTMLQRYWTDAGAVYRHLPEWGIYQIYSLGRLQRNITHRKDKKILYIIMYKKKLKKYKKIAFFTIDKCVI